MEGRTFYPRRGRGFGRGFGFRGGFRGRWSGYSRPAFPVPTTVQQQAPAPAQNVQQVTEPTVQPRKQQQWVNQKSVIAYIEAQKPGSNNLKAIQAAVEKITPPEAHRAFAIKTVLDGLSVDKIARTTLATIFESDEKFKQHTSVVHVPITAKVKTADKPGTLTIIQFNHAKPKTYQELMYNSPTAPMVGVPQMEVMTGTEVYDKFMTSHYGSHSRAFDTLSTYKHASSDLYGGPSYHTHSYEHDKIDRLTKQLEILSEQVNSSPHGSHLNETLLKSQPTQSTGLSTAVLSASKPNGQL